MIISIDEEKAFDQVQHPFLIKTLNKVGLEGIYLKIIKSMQEKPTVNTLFNGRKTEFSPKVKKKTSMSPLTTFIQPSTQSPDRGSQTTKGIHAGKEEVKLPLFADDMILNRENSQDSTEELLELANAFRKPQRYKSKCAEICCISIQ